MTTQNPTAPSLPDSNETLRRSQEFRRELFKDFPVDEAIARYRWHMRQAKALRGLVELAAPDKLPRHPRRHRT